MTYFGFLLRFLVIPILFLAGVHLWEIRKGLPEKAMAKGKGVWIAIAIHVALALVYTTPWDNYLVASGVWYYNPSLVTGIIFGYVPLEEYTFFILQTIFVGLWWWLLARYIVPPRIFKPTIKIRVWSVVVLFTIWLGSTIVFFSGWAPGTYLSITLFWALPPIIIQSIFGADILWHHRKLVLSAILPMGLYLSLTDSFAIAAATWTIHPAQSTGLFIGALPIEEGVFFFITVILITFGVTLLRAEESRERLMKLSFVRWSLKRSKEHSS